MRLGFSKTDQGAVGGIVIKLRFSSSRMYAAERDTSGDEKRKMTDDKNLLEIKCDRASSKVAAITDNYA